MNSNDLIRGISGDNRCIRLFLIIGNRMDLESGDFQEKPDNLGANNLYLFYNIF